LEQQNMFDTLKEKLTSCQVLNYPDFSQQFLITTITSDYARSGTVARAGRLRPT